MKSTGAEIIMKCLVRQGVTTILGYPGGANMPLYDALFGYSKKVRHILVRHEQAATHAAEGYARATGKPGVCFATSGPGATNLVTGIADAKMDSTPLVCITGQVAAHLIGSDAFQEVDIVGITKPITKWNIQVTNASQIEEAIHSAFYHATEGRPGPVLVDIAKSAQLEMGEYKKIPLKHQLVHKTNNAVDTIQKAAEILNTAKKPLVIVGHGAIISNAQKELLLIAELTNAPVACTLLGISAIPASHPQYVGMVGMHGHYAPNVLTNEADVVVAVGMRFDDRVTSTLATYAPHARIIHIDIDAKEINKNVKNVLGICMDAKEALVRIAPFLKKQNYAEWLQQFKKNHAIEQETVITPQIHPDNSILRMAEVIHILSDISKGNALIVSDVGQNQMMVARYYKFEKWNHYFSSGGLGTMGFSLPAAIGAQIASPSEQVISISGDGGFQMNIQELATIAQEHVPLKMVILNNGYLGMVRQWQQLFFDKRYSFTTMHNPDFIAIAQAYGIQGKKVAERAMLKQELSTMLSHRGAYLLEIDVEQEGNVFPMIAPGASVSDVRLS